MKEGEIYKQTKDLSLTRKGSLVEIVKVEKTLVEFIYVSQKNNGLLAGFTKVYGIEEFDKLFDKYHKVLPIQNIDLS